MGAGNVVHFEGPRLIFQYQKKRWGKGRWRSEWWCLLTGEQTEATLGAAESGGSEAGLGWIYIKDRGEDRLRQLGRLGE